MLVFVWQVYYPAILRLLASFGTDRVGKSFGVVANGDSVKNSSCRH